MAPHMWIFRLIQFYEDRIIEMILRRPGFHRAVGRIHRAVNEKQYGRNPNEPLRPGDATADPNLPQGRSSSFLQHFRDEIRNQFRGKPTDISEPPPPPPPRGKK